MSKNFKSGFTMIDSLIGLTIISIFSVLYFQTVNQMNQQLKEAQQVMINERHNYEEFIIKK
ncbi:MAG: type II secretion system protein [Lentilactobacillus diolivorans]